MPLEGMNREEINEILEHLFPKDQEGFEADVWAGKLDDGMWEESYDIDVCELRRVMKRATRDGGKAPGPDGINSMIWRKVVEIAPDTVAKVLTKCLKERRFPKSLKSGRLVLIKKVGKGGRDPWDFRPICLMNEKAKLLEKILVDRIWKVGLRKDKKVLNKGINLALRKMERLGLRIAPEKTQAMVVTRGRTAEVKRLKLAIEGERLIYGGEIEYLGMYIDRGRNYVKHAFYVRRRRRLVEGQ